MKHNRVSHKSLFKIFYAMFFTMNCHAAQPNDLTISLEHKIGQMMLVHFNGETANEASKALIDRVHVAGFVLYRWANGLHDKNQVKQLTQSLQQQAGRSLFIAIDQEGGRVVRLRDCTELNFTVIEEENGSDFENFSESGMNHTSEEKFPIDESIFPSRTVKFNSVRSLTEGFTKVPANGAITDETQSYTLALQVGKELREVGININFAPVVDIALPEGGGCINDRSYSSNPKRVTKLALGALMGYAETGVIATLKHFPGHGHANADTHLGLSVVPCDRRHLEQNELAPFRELAPIAPLVMTSHVLVPVLDPLKCATVSDIIIKEELLGRCHFEGVVITDSLVMQGLLDATGSVEEAAVAAIKAGHDFLLFGGKQLTGSSEYELFPKDLIRIHQHLCQAVRDGTLSEERIDQSIAKIHTLRENYLCGSSSF